MTASYYESLGHEVHRPDILLRDTFFGLKDYYDYLKLARENADKTRLRLAWELGEQPEKWEGADGGLWVQLADPEDGAKVGDQTYRAFLDDSVRFVEEIDSNLTGRRRAERINVLDRDPGTCQLCLERRPTTELLALQANTYGIDRQLAAIKSLQDAPARDHLPLLRLLESSDHAARRWQQFVPSRLPEEEWLLLRAENGSDSKGLAGELGGDHGVFVRFFAPRPQLRPGTESQRRFVECALATPDFAFLEGPPGSGKTTAICELILQLATAGKRVLLCASTHVAVDNVLERLMAASNPHRDSVIPVRIGDSRNVSDGAKPYRLEEFCRTEKLRISKGLRTLPALSAAQEEFLRIVEGDGKALLQMVLDAANLVCGTTMGILQHPSIKDMRGRPVVPTYDYLILDEASKTTFQEFLVPALHAKRWVIVGDAKQLSPYVEEDEIAANIAGYFPDESSTRAALDLFLTAREGRPAPLVLLTRDATLRQVYEVEAAQRGLVIARAEDEPDTAEIAAAHVVLADESALPVIAERLPLDLTWVRGEGAIPKQLKRRLDANQARSRFKEPESWASEVAWRTVRSYEKRFAESVGKDRRWDEVVDLIPKSLNGTGAKGLENLRRLRRVALPSVLELLQHGFEKRDGQWKENALTEGLPDSVFAARHVLLEYQHRMHPDISAFSRERIYDGKALKDPEDMSRRRECSYSANRAAWVHVDGVFDRRQNANPQEAAAVMKELERFFEWARANPQPAGEHRCWEVAVLAFYRGQERELRKLLRKRTGQPKGYRHFALHHGGQRRLNVELCTVDRFQGHEADVIFLSIANDHPTDFFDSPNRLNVAITRARFLRIIFGNRVKLRRATRDGEPPNIFQQLISWHDRRDDLSYGEFR